MMLDVIFALLPAIVMAIVVFRWYAVVQIGLCVLACLATEAAGRIACGQRAPLHDCSAAVTGMILGLIAALEFALVCHGPWVFRGDRSGQGRVRGLGCNIFNPAMVGRAFVMLSFAKQMGALGLCRARLEPDRRDPRQLRSRWPSSSPPTWPLAACPPANPKVQMEAAEDIWALLVGQVNGSLGRPARWRSLSAACILLVRRVISWEIPVGIMLVALVFVELGHWTDLTLLDPLHHMITGSLLFGAFFIATDPVTSPVTRMGRLVYGMGVGFFVVVIRLFSSYPEGVMFAVLLMNAAVPLLNRWTIPRPLGGVPPRKA